MHQYGTVARTLDLDVGGKFPVLVFIRFKKISQYSTLNVNVKYINYNFGIKLIHIKN